WNSPAGAWKENALPRRCGSDELRLCGASLVRLANEWREPCDVRVVTIRRPTRLPDFPYVGFYRYSLRFATHGRDRHFVAVEPVAAACTQIERTAEEDQFAILAYCFMPDHLHLVIEGLAETSDLRRFTKVTKQ